VATAKIPLANPVGTWARGSPGGEWRDSPLDAGDIDPEGIKEIVEYDTGDEDVLRPRPRDEYGPCEEANESEEGSATQ
jgi:hypothetical protein